MLGCNGDLKVEVAKRSNITSSLFLYLLAVFYPFQSSAAFGMKWQGPAGWSPRPDIPGQAFCRSAEGRYRHQ